MIGSSIVLDGRPRTIVGVMPAGVRAAVFLDHGGVDPDRHGDAAGGHSHAPHVDGPGPARAAGVAQGSRRLPGAVLDAGTGAISADARRTAPGWRVPLRDELVGSARPALVATAAAAALLLLIVATNIAGLSTAHAVSARHQLAVRAALGATRSRLFVEQLVDSVVLAAVGSLAGVGIAYGADPGRRPLSAVLSLATRADRA